MTFLLENPIPIYFVGGLLLLITGLTFLARRTLSSLLWFAGMLLGVLLLLAVERVVVTDREEIEFSLGILMDSLARNDMQNVLAQIDPNAAEVRADVQAMMPEAKVEDTGATMIHVDLDPDDSAAAFSQFMGKVEGTHIRTGQRIFYFDEVRIDWAKQDGRWVLTGYQARWDGKPIDAVNSLRANRPKP